MNNNITELLKIPAVRLLVIFLALWLLFTVSRKLITKEVQQARRNKTRQTEHQPDKGNFSREPQYYKNFAKRIGESMEGIFHIAGGPRDIAFQEAIAMNDDELAEVNNQYSKMFENTLLTDVQGEIGMYYTDIDDKLEARLRALGAT
jgi:ABC-type nickel/cobalt efflux system permease component RcnA